MRSKQPATFAFLSGTLGQLKPKNCLMSYFISLKINRYCPLHDNRKTLKHPLVGLRLGSAALADVVALLRLGDTHFPHCINHQEISKNKKQKNKNRNEKK